MSTLPFVGDGISGIIKGIGSIADDLFTSDEERLKIALADKKVDASLKTGQMQVNATEATHKSIFVAGWRPFIGWVGGFALGYQFLLYPLMAWFWTFAQAKSWLPYVINKVAVTPPPPLDVSMLYTVIMGMLGVGVMRSYDKRSGNQTDSIKKKLS